MHEEYFDGAAATAKEEKTCAGPRHGHARLGPRRLSPPYRDLIETPREARQKGEPMASISWNKDVDAALADAKTRNKPLLVDFSAAPL
jgi:hypothetical protein